MSDSSTTLKASLSKLQRKAVKYYLEQAQRFEKNNLIRDKWAAMASDIQLQAESLKNLPLSFWKHLKGEERDLLEEARKIDGFGKREEQAEGALNISFSRTLDFEEPVITKLYAPVVLHLRSSWNDRALDFYIMVRAHIARLQRFVKPFSGNPALIHRCTSLLERFEKETQEPGPVRFLRGARPRPAREQSVVRTRKPVKKAASRKVDKSASSRPKSAKPKSTSKPPEKKRTSKRPKPIVKVKRTGVPRRRARR